MPVSEAALKTCTRSGSRVVFEAEASVGGGSKAGGLPTLPFPLSLPSPFHSIQFSDKPVGGKVRSSEGGTGEVPRLPPYKYHP